MVKKAYLKSIEMLIVIVLTLVFLVVVIPRQESLDIGQKKNILINLQDSEVFRDFVINNNGCFNSTPTNSVTLLINQYIPQEYDYKVCTGPKARTLPEKTVYIDSLMFAGNLSNTEFKTIRLYYWPKS